MITKVTQLFIILILIPLISIPLWGTEYPNSLIDQLEGKPISSIQFEGLVNVEEEVIASLISLSEGSIFQFDNVSRDFHLLYDQDYFKEIAVDAELDVNGEVVLTWMFQEYPIIDELEFDGLDELDESDLTEVMALKNGQSFNPNLQTRDTEAIIDKYKEEGFHETEVEFEVQELENNRIKLVVNVREGEQIFIENIEILGVRHLDPEDLEDAMELTESVWYYPDDVFDEEEFEKDLQRIVQYCKNEGYVEAEIEDYDIDIDYIDDSGERGYFITISVIEGEQYTMGEVEFLNNTIFTTEELQEMITQEPGEIYNDETFMMDMQMIQLRYFDRGYIQSRITPIPELDREQNIINYTVDIYESEKVHIEHITIQGNDKTLTYVIDRELMIMEGEVFSISKITRSQERLYNTQYFDNVTFTPRRGSEEGLIDLVFNVHEQRTGIITLGVGFGTESGFTGFEEISENNLFGTGWRISERIEYGQRRQIYKVGVDTRYLLPYIPIRFGFSIAWQVDTLVPVYDSIFAEILSEPGDHVIVRDPITQQEAEFGDITYDSKGLITSVTGGYEFFDFYNFFVTYQFSLLFTDPPHSGYGDREIPIGYLDSDSPLTIDIEQGNEFKSSLRFGFVWDKRDLTLNTTRGFRIAQIFEYTGGIIGGDSNYLRTDTDFSFFYTPFRMDDGTPYFVIALHLNVELLWPQFGEEFIRSRDINNIDKLYFDGMNELRGWRSFSTNILDGYGKLSAGAEIRIPIPGVKQIVWGVLFFDAGNVGNNPRGGVFAFPYQWNETPRFTQDTIYSYRMLPLSGDALMGYKFSMGFGFRIQIPMLPIRLYFAKRFWRQQDGDGGHIEWGDGLETVFSVGGLF